MALTKVTSGVLADDDVGVAGLSATGTASASTFLRGDNAWASAAAGFSDMKFKTASETYTVPTGITKIVIDLVAAGGGGNSQAAGTNGLGGGGGGGQNNTNSGPGGSGIIVIRYAV